MGMTKITEAQAVMNAELKSIWFDLSFKNWRENAMPATTKEKVQINSRHLLTRLLVKTPGYRNA